MTRDHEYRARDKKTHKMTRDGLVEHNEATGEEILVSRREQDYDPRTALSKQSGGTREESLRPTGDGKKRPHRQPSAPSLETDTGQEGSFSDRKQDTPHDEAPPSQSRDAAPDLSRRRQTHETTGQKPFRDADRPERLQYDDARIKDTSGAQPRQRGTKYHQQFTSEAAKPEPGAAGAATPKTDADKPKSPKLNFAPDELPPETAGKKLTKARSKAERADKNLEKARENLPTRHRLRLDKEFDPEKGKMTRRPHLEKEVKSKAAHVKGPLVTRPAKAGANAAVGYAHKKIHEVEHENIGVEAAHKGEMLAEGALRTAWRRKKTAPYRKVAKLEKKSLRLNVRAAYQQALQDNPKLKSNLLSRTLQKRKIKRQYAKAARDAKRAGQAAQKAGTATARLTQAVTGFVRRHPLIFAMIGGLLLLVMIFSSMFSSCSNMSIGSMGGLLASTYLAEDKDIDDAELAYTEWETDLQIRINTAEADHPGYDEYRYQVDDIGHNPFELMGYLTAVYQNFNFTDVQAALRQIFEEQYSLSFVEETEIRYRTETHTDPDTGEEYEVEVSYEWHIVNINLSAGSFGELVVARMDAGQRQICEILLQTKGNRQYVSNVFNFNWLPYVTSYYGYRVHPVSGEKNYHKGVDIGVAQGTEILAGHDGVVTQAGNAGDYGLIVALEGDIPGDHTLTTKYAHNSQVLVSVGQQIKKGDVIAKVGSTGNSTGPHLHLEVLVDGQYLNPLYFADTGDNGSGNLPPGTPGGPEFSEYPGEPMGDGSYAALIAEAQKHLGKPYVFGAKGPDKFDCSGFVCWSLTHSGVKSIATNAQGLYNASTPVSRENAMPGDLIFFKGTYSTPNTVTHVGIYIGNGMMIHAGKPVQYASIDTRYWTEHFYAFGRLN